MKLMNFLPMGAAALLLAFVACTDEMTEVQSGELRQIVMTAFDFETEDGSRTNFQITSSGAEFSWAANDTVGIFPNEGAQAYFPMTSGAGTKSANFTGGGWALKDASTYAAYYPFIGDFYLNKNAIPVDYTGQVQTGDASTAHLGAYDYMAAIPAIPRNGNVSFAFKHLGVLVQLKLTIPQATILNSVTLTTESNAFAVKGTMDVMASAPSITSVTSAKEVTLELKELATTEANQIVTLYVMLPPVDLGAKTLKAVVKTSNGTEEVALGSKNFQAGKAYALNGSLEDKTNSGRTIKMETAGTMKQILGNDYLNIESLKIVGPINGDDIYYLRKMLGGNDFSQADWGKLTTLDLSNAIIEEGGDWYYEGEEYMYADYKRHYTSNHKIGDYMFNQCANLQKIVLPYKVFSIGEYAFYECKALKSITIGSGVTSIGHFAFVGCDAVSVHITDLSAWCKITFSPLSNMKLYLNGEELTEMLVPGDITEIKQGPFSSCQSLKKVIISDNVTAIHRSAFYECKALKSITIGSGVTSIGNAAFEGCEALNSIDVPDNVLSIDNFAFYECKALKSITIGNGVTSIGTSAFRFCDALTSITIGSGVTSIGNAAFEGCEALTDFYCHATTPPSVVTSSYYLSFPTYGDKTTLHVPKRCGSIYKSSKWGIYFKNIVEMD